MKLTDEITEHIGQLPGHVESRKTAQLLIQARDKLGEFEELTRMVFAQHAPYGDICRCVWCREAREALK